MACKRAQSFLFGANYLRCIKNKVKHIQRLVHYNSEREDALEEGERLLPAEWYNIAFSKMKRWSHSLKEFDLIGGRLVSIRDHSRIFDAKLERKMHAFKNIARVFIGHPSVLETTRRNLVVANVQYSSFQFFNKQHEREALTVNSLTKVSDMLDISAQQRKVVRHTICPQVTQHNVWTGALVEILSGLKSEIEVLIDRRPSKEVKLAQQIVISCLKLLESAMSYDPENSSWMRLKPTKAANSSDSPTWEGVLEMSVDLVNSLSNEMDLTFHVSKLEVMKEGLYQIRDILIDKNMGYKETRYQEHLVQKKLTKTLGHSSRCLFTVLLYYLFGIVEDIEVEVCGGLHVVGKGNKYCLYMGKILTLDEEKIVWNGVKQLDRTLGLFKFVWETAAMKGDLESQGHLWCIGGQCRSFTYRGNTYFLHGINL